MAERTDASGGEAGPVVEAVAIETMVAIDPAPEKDAPDIAASPETGEDALEAEAVVVDYRRNVSLSVPNSCVILLR